MTQQKTTPGRWLYGLAAVIVIAGIAGFCVLLFSNISGMTRGLTQVVVPGQGTVEIEKPGTYTVFYEYQSVVGNKVYATEESLSGLECSLVHEGSGTTVPLTPVTTSSTYSVGGRSGRALFTFTVDRAGSYTLFADYDPGHTGPDVVLAVGSDVTMKIIGTVFGAIAIMFVSMILAVVIVIVIFLKRRKTRQSLQDSVTSA
jgi:hypothetical protein